MLKREYFLKVINSNTYRLRDWVISVFSVCRSMPTLSEVKYPYTLITDSSNKDKLFAAVPNEDGGYRAEVIEDSERFKPLFEPFETLSVKSKDIPLDCDDVETTYGIILGNMYLLYYPFGTKFKFVNEVISDDFDDIIYDLLTDDVNDIGDEKRDRIYVREYLRYSDACEMLASFDHLFISSGGEKTLTVDESVLKLRDKLIAENKDNLGDIVVQAKISEALVKADKASFANNRDALNYLVSGKAFNPTRLKQLISIGGSAGFGTGGTASYIPRSLRDGWRKEDIPVHANEARSGSYFRGKETQYGGADVKIGNRMMMNSSIVKEYCGTTRGITQYINDFNKKKFLGLWLVNKDKPILITKDNIQRLVGTVQQIHSPQYCVVGNAKFCSTCLGRVYSYLPKGVPSIVTNIFDTYMYDKMKRMHGKANVTVEVDIFAVAS